MAVNIDLRFVVAAFASKTATRRRSAAGSYVHGEWVNGAVTETPVTIQTATPKAWMMRLLPEGVRSRARFQIHSNDDLRGADERNHEQADWLQFDGRWYVIAEVQDRSQTHGMFRKLLALEEPNALPF